MADSSLRVTRRPKGSPRRSLTAASQPITNPSVQVKGTKAAGFGATGTDWQAEAWDFYDGDTAVGELHFYVGWKAGSCSRVRLVASAVDSETGMPTGSIEEDDTDGQRVAEYVRAIADGPLGQQELIRRCVECIAVVGEVWIAVIARGKRYRDGTPRFEWFALNKDEFRTNRSNDETELTLPDGSKHIYNREVDSMLRVWKPRARRATEPDSPVRSTLDSLREINRTSKKIKNAAKSRLINAGVLFLPEELSLPASRAPIAEDQALLPGVALPDVTGTSAADTLADMLYQAGVASMEDENSQAAFIPLMGTVPGQFLDKVQHIRFDTDITDVEIKTRTDAITRLAMGLDVSPERLLGFGASNHWSAWQIEDTDVQLHIAPPMVMLCQAIYNDILRGLLEAEGIDADKYVLWYDASQLTADPDLTDEATQAKDRGSLRNDVYLQKMGLPEDGGYDLTTLEGAQLWAREAITADPTLITTLAPLLDGELAAIDWPVAAQPAIGDGNAQPGEGQDDGDADSEPDTEDDADEEPDAIAASAAPTSRAEYVLAERLLVNRGLELSAKRRVNVRDTTQKARLAGRPPHEWHRYLPPVRETDIGKLTAGWDNGLDATCDRLGIDAGPLRESVRRSLKRELTSQVIDGEVAS